MKRFLAVILGEGRCPNCEGGLTQHEAGFHVCATCHVVVDYAKGAWRFAGGMLRQLPGLSGLSFQEPPTETEKAA